MIAPSDAAGAGASARSNGRGGRRVELFRPEDPAWEDWLRGVRHDIFHTSGYHEYARDAGEGEPFLVVAGDRDRGVAWPYLLRAISTVPGLAASTATDINSVYGYPGPLAWGCVPGDSFVEWAWAEIVDVWRQQRAVSAFTRFHPLLGNASLISGLRIPGGSARSSGGVVDGGKTVSVNLAQGPEAARREYSRDIAREARALRRAGMTTIHDTEWRYLHEFARLYRDTMVRSDAPDYYFFTEDDFRRLLAALGDRLHLLVTLHGDTVTAAGLFTELDGIVEWYLVGTSDEYRHLSPSKLLVDDAIDWAHARGASVMHLGGGRGGRADTLLWFKSRFSPHRHAFNTGRWTLDADAYRMLSEVRAAGLASGESLDPTYFPLFRAPVIATGDRPVVTSRRTVLMEVQHVGGANADALADLLPRIDPTYFQPHAMTPDEAYRIAAHQGRDVYVMGLADDGSPVAYGLLRGWDEGFDVPSLGIGVRRDYERRGYGRKMIDTLHGIARERGAHQVRLRVHPDNAGARALYLSVGYVEAGIERSEILMTLDL